MDFCVVVVMEAYILVGDFTLIGEYSDVYLVCV